MWTPGWLEWSRGKAVQDMVTMESHQTDFPGPIVSVTKAFTSTVILQLLDEGLLTLEDTTPGRVRSGRTRMEGTSP